MTDSDPPITAPATARKGMRVTGGYCPEFWRWRVAAVSARGITLASSKQRLRIAADQWLPWLARCCDTDHTYIDAQRIVRPAAEALVLPGDTVKPAPDDLRFAATPSLPERLRAARALLATHQVRPGRLIGTGTCVQFCGDRVNDPVEVVYDVASGMLPVCRFCRPPGLLKPQAMCCHGLAALLRDPAAHALLLRCLT